MRKVTSLEIVENWEEQGALWLMEDPMLFNHNACEFMDAQFGCSPEAALLTDLINPQVPSHIKQTIACRKDLLPSQVQTLSFDTNPAVRRHVVLFHWRKHKDIISHLLCDNDRRVRCALARLARVEVKDVPDSVFFANDFIMSHAENIQVSNDVNELEEAANHWCFYVRKGVSLNPITPPEVLDRLFADGKLHKILANHGMASQGLLERLAHSPDFKVRLCVARNKNTEKSILSILAQDQCRYVRRAAQNRISGRKDIGRGLKYKNSFNVDC